MQSIDNNKGFHDYLKSDCENKSLIYIGCSLDDELDIKYSILNNQKDMQSIGNNYRIYVSRGKLTPYKKALLESFRITHYIEIEQTVEYSKLYEFFYQCYEKSKIDDVGDIENYKYKKQEYIDNDREINIDYLVNIVSNQTKLPRYFINRDESNYSNLRQDKLNVLSGRRFSGKTLLAIGILEHYADRSRYYIPSSASIDISFAKRIIEKQNAVVIFDSNSIDDAVFQYLVENIQQKNNAYICVVMNTFDSIYDLVAYNSTKVNNCISERCQKGYLSEQETNRLNEKLNKLQIGKFSENSNILDNTMRIAGAYDKFYTISQRYILESHEECKV